MFTEFIFTIEIFKFENLHDFPSHFICQEFSKLHVFQNIQQQVRLTLFIPGVCTMRTGQVYLSAISTVFNAPV